MLGESNLLGLLEANLAGDEADAFEAFVSLHQTQFTRLANTRVIQDSRIDDAQLIVKALVDDRLGAVTTNDLTAEGLVRARRSAAEIARSAAAKTFPAGFNGDGQNGEVRAPAFDSETAEAKPSDRARWLEGPLSQAAKANLLLAGNFHTGQIETAIWNTAGLARYAKTTRAEANLIALDGLQPGDSTGYAGALQSGVQGLDLGSIAHRALDKALAGRSPAELEPAAYDVLLEPAAVASLLEWLNVIGFNSEAVEKNMSFMSDNLGNRITGQHVTLIDDPTASDAPGVPFDSEGTTKQNILLIENGVARNHVFDREAGHKAGCSSTGHAGFGGVFSKGAVPTHLSMSAGQDDVSDLMSRIERGISVTRFHYVNGMLEPMRAVMTGLTRDGTFLIENGKRSQGIRNLRFTDSVLEAFSRIEGLSRTRERIGTWWSALGALTAPAVLIRGLQFTGKTSRN